MAQSDDDKHWRFPRTLNLGTMIVIGIQTVTVIWFFASLRGDVDDQGQRISALESVRAGERLAVLESTIGDIRQQLNRIEAKLDRYAERDRPHP